MKRLLIITFSFFFFISTCSANHIIGGEMRYTYTGPGSSPNSKVYTITLLLFRGDDPAGAALAPTYIVAIYNNDNLQKVRGTAGSTGDDWLIVQQSVFPVPIVFPSCIQNAPDFQYTYGVYTMSVELPVNLNGYTVAYQTCCRISGMINVGNSEGSTYNCIIPGTNLLPDGDDSSPQFGVSLNVICKNSPFTLNFAATDPDGDSLVYSLCNAFGGGIATNAGFDDPAPPPYNSVSYLSPYSGGNPLGTSATLNPQTGIITGIAPDFGKYVVCVCITVFRNGRIIGSHHKDLIVQVSDCTVTAASPMPSFVTCDGFNIQFSHNSTGATTVFWDFGDPSTLIDTSNIDSPTYVYPVAGTYNIKFVVNRGTGCADSAFRTVGVFPGFFPGFVFFGNCFTNPFQFIDTTKTNYGTVNTWHWNFGDASTLSDTSHVQNPQWTYPNGGPRDVTLIVTNSKGCVDTATVTVPVLDKPPITLTFADTLICIPDAVTLMATGSGVFNWTPVVSISNPNISNPTVNPTVTTWYVVHLNENGCVNKDSVQVRVVGNVSLNAGADTTICLTDAAQLHAVSNGLQYQWTPAGTLNNPNISNPLATPTLPATVYQVKATIGSCSAISQVTVSTVPYPIANAGPNQEICYNTSVQLNGSHNGLTFSWSPVSYLNNPNILNPISSPPRTTAYILTVLDNKGCPKPGRDTIVVTVRPKVRAFAGRDTTVVVGQPLQFNGSGGVGYLWVPSTDLNNPHIFNPVGIYASGTDSIRYKLIVTDSISCADSAFITVRVFETNPSVFVPTAFTPNGDGRNDVIRPIAVGIQRINYFSIYNRWGQLVFTTTINGQGWDGKINSRPQGSGVFVWMVSAVDYTGKTIFLKGTVTLIR